MANATVSRKSMADQVADLVRNMILVGDLRPGERVTHDALASRLDVSTMPVREALLRLAYEGLLESRPGRSYRVAVATRNDVRDIYWMHGLLAGELTARTATKADNKVLDELRSIHEQWQRTTPPPSPAQLEALNETFHRLINRAADAPKLTLLLRNTLRLIPQHFYSLLPTWSDAALQRHGEIIDAIARRRPEEARRAAELHAHEAGELLLERFDDLGYWTLPTESAS